MKWFRRFRARLSKSLAPVQITSRSTHTAYPESHVDEDGSWVLRFYNYEGSAVIVDELIGKESTHAAALKTVERKTQQLVAKYRRA